MLLNARLVSLIFTLSLLFGVAANASAAGTAKSWDVDLYDDAVGVTYVDDGYDDVNVYDHSYNNSNDYGYDYGYEYSPRVTFNYDRDDDYGYYDDRSYSRDYDRGYRSRYYDDYRRW